MPAIPNPPRTVHPDCLDLSRPADIDFWAVMFEVTSTELRVASRVVGNNLIALGRYVRAQRAEMALCLH